MSFDIREFMLENGGIFNIETGVITSETGVKIYALRKLNFIRSNEKLSTNLCIFLECYSNAVAGKQLWGFELAG